MDPVRVVFLGSPQFAVPSLESLIVSDAIDVSLVVTQPDRPSGRGRKLQPPPVKLSAQSHAIATIQPETLKDEQVLDRLRTLDPDVLVIVSYGEILRRDVLELPKFGCLNVHPSLLPSYRGSIPIQATILNGDPDAGISIIRLVRRMDAGPILSQTRVPLTGEETAGSLSQHLAQKAGELLPDVIIDWVRGVIKETPQDEYKATYCRELTKSDAQIDWRWSADYIERFVRAMSPWPRAWTVAGDNRLSIDAVSLSRDREQQDVNAAPGQVFRDGQRVRVAAGDGMLALGTVQPAGKKSMQAADWIRGLQASDSIRFGSPDKDRPPLVFTQNQKS